MAKEMRAAVYLGTEKIELCRVAIPEPAAGELLVKVRAAVTCGTDVKTYRRGHPEFPPPFIFGHEFAGDVVISGKGVGGFCGWEDRPAVQSLRSISSICIVALRRTLDRHLI